MINLNAVDVSYDVKGGKKALESINLNVDGDKVVVIGSNGSGKTTLIKVILGLVNALNGEVLLNGKNVRNISGETGVSTNLSDVYRLINVTVYDIISLYSKLKGYKPDEPLNLISEFDLKDILDKRIYQLSSGEQKMVGNILALSFSPKTVLLDEPFDNIDQGRRIRLIRHIKALDSEVLMNTHELDLLSKLSNWKMCFIIEGKLYGKYDLSMLDSLYITPGEESGNLGVIKTSFGIYSVTFGRGKVKISSAPSLNSLLDGVE